MIPAMIPIISLLRFLKLSVNATDTWMCFLKMQQMD